MKSFPLVTFALSLATLAVASPVSPAFAAQDDQLVARGSLLDRREVRASAVSNLALRRNADEAQDLEYAESFQAVERALDALAAAEGLSKRDLQQRAHDQRRLSDVSCGKGTSVNHKICQNAARSTALPKNGRAVCDAHSGRCKVACGKGFSLKNGMCYKNAKVCQKQKCPNSPPNGVYTCVKSKYKNSYCKLVCDQGLVPNRKGAKCLDLKNDRFHCGGENHKCAFSYNGHGKPICVKGKCTGKCLKKGNLLKFTKSGQFYCVRP